MIDSIQKKNCVRIFAVEFFFKSRDCVQKQMDERRNAERVDKVVSSLIDEARSSADSSSKWIYAFFFVLIVTWINYAVDLTAGGRGLPAKRITQANQAASEAYKSCRAGGSDCKDDVDALRDAMSLLNNDIDFVVFSIKDVDIIYQSIIVVIISFLVLAYISWNRRKLFNILARIEKISGRPTGEVSSGLSSFPAPMWFWSLPNRKRAIRQSEIDPRLISRSIGGLFLMVALLLMAGHTVWIHYKLAFDTIGAEFEDFAPGQSWGLLAEFQNELPHPMAFTGSGPLDVIILIGGFVGAYAALDISLSMAGPLGGPQGKPAKQLANKVGRRALIVGALLASVIAADKAWDFAKSLPRRVPRFLGRAGSKPIALGLPPGIYVNRRPTGRAPVYHFVRVDGTAQDLFAPGIRDRLVRIDVGGLVDPSVVETNSIRPEAVEWAAINHLAPAHKDPKKAIEILVRSVDKSIRQYSPDKKVDMRNLDLAAGLSRRFENKQINSVVSLSEQLRRISHKSEQRALTDRISKWTDENSKWSKKWASNKGVRWNHIDIG